MAGDIKCADHLAAAASIITQAAGPGVHSHPSVMIFATASQFSLIDSLFVEGKSGRFQQGGDPSRDLLRAVSSQAAGRVLL